MTDVTLRAAILPWVLAVLSACSAGRVSTTSAGRVDERLFFGRRDLEALGYGFEDVGRGAWVATDGTGSVCLRELPCRPGVSTELHDPSIRCLGDPEGEEGGCITFERNVEIFRRLLESPGEGRSVFCARAEVGTCGPFDYFMFEGDIYRHEVRFFDRSTGRLVSQRDSVDYDPYCGAGHPRWLGPIPRCGPMERRELICGRGEGRLRSPVESYR